MTINTFTTPYPDFINNEIINPDQFDANSASIGAKLNELIPRVNAHDLAQITNDVGAPQVSASLSTDNILDMLVAKGVGFHTFYAISTSQGLPIARAFRGICHITSTGFGWAWATDSSNNLYTNYFDNSAWSGWDSKDAPIWTTLPLVSGITGTSGRIPRYTRRGGEVIIEGELAPISGTTVLLSTLPLGYRPPTTRLFKTAHNFGTSNDGATVYVSPDGTVMLQVATNSTQAISLMGVRFFMN